MSAFIEAGRRDVGVTFNTTDNPWLVDFQDSPTLSAASPVFTTLRSPLPLSKMFLTNGLEHHRILKQCELLTIYTQLGFGEKDGDSEL